MAERDSRLQPSVILLTTTQNVSGFSDLADQ